MHVFIDGLPFIFHTTLFNDFMITGPQSMLLEGIPSFRVVTGEMLLANMERYRPMSIKDISSFVNCRP